MGTVKDFDITLPDGEQVALAIGQSEEGTYVPLIIFQLFDKKGKEGHFIFECTKGTKKLKHAENVLTVITEFFNADQITFVEDSDSNREGMN